MILILKMLLNMFINTLKNKNKYVMYYSATSNAIITFVIALLLEQYSYTKMV